MKRTGLLNRHLSQLVASLGHMDEVTVADAGLPMPQGVPVIDLAITPGLPRFWDVLAGLQQEMVIESVVWATDASAGLSDDMNNRFDQWAKAQGAPIQRDQIPHSDFKQHTARSRAIIRTGEATPYANVILVSGVSF